MVFPHLLTHISVTKKWIPSYAKAIQSLDFHEVDRRFAEKAHRVLGGRSNEVIYLEMTNVPPTYYSLLSAFDNTALRYVRYISALKH